MAYETKNLAVTTIDISGREVEVKIIRNSDGNISVIPTDFSIFEKGGWLENGHCSEGEDMDIIISKFIH
tara:strand:- start:1577 stop:1783 length:207 start_codon:yes stop_codon:yes gene_type:complete